jgi:SAM-dependent methyltransferase
MQTKEIQGKLWSTAPADWARYLEPTFIPMYQSVLKELTLDEEKNLLDAGCGSGLFLSMVAATGASIHGIDAAAGLLSISSQRLPETTLLIEDLEALPFGDETFDVVTGFNSFQYAGSFQQALTEAARVTKKDGKAVIGIWGKEEDCESGAVLKAVGSLLPTPPPGTPGPFALSEEGKVEDICEGAGLKVIKKEHVFCPWQFTGTDALVRAFLCTGPCVKASQAVGENKVRETILQSAEPFNLADEVYFMRNYFTFFITEKI